MTRSNQLPVASVCRNQFVHGFENSIACNDQDEMKQFQTDAKLSRSEENVTKSSSGKVGRKSKGGVK